MDPTSSLYTCDWISLNGIPGCGIGPPDTLDIPWVDDWSTDPRVLGCHIQSHSQYDAINNYKNYKHKLLKQYVKISEKIAKLCNNSILINHTILFKKKKLK